MSWKLNLELYHENHEIVSPFKHYSCIFVHFIYIFNTAAELCTPPPCLH